MQRLLILIIGILSLHNGCIRNEVNEHKEKARTFLESATYSMDFVFLHSYLRTKHDLDSLPQESETQSIMDSLLLLSDEKSRETYQSMQMFYRLIDKNYKAGKETLVDLNDVDVISLPALYCDVLPVDSAKYFHALRSAADQGGYMATHALLAILWLEDFQCFTKSELTSVKSLVVKSNLQILDERDGRWLDLHIETLALLKAAGQKIPNEMIIEIIQLQREDGGWAERPSDLNSSTHTTILAYWLLLDL